MRRAINTRLTPPNRFLALSMPRVLNTAGMASVAKDNHNSVSMKNFRPVNFDGYFETFKTIYAPALESVVKNQKNYRSPGYWNCTTSRDKVEREYASLISNQCITRSIGLFTETLTFVRANGRLPKPAVPIKASLDPHSSSVSHGWGNDDFAIYKFHDMPYRLNYILTLFGKAADREKIMHRNDSVERAQILDYKKKIKLFQYSLFHLATAFETELFRYDLMKPDRLVSDSYWPDEFYGDDVIKEFRDQHKGLLIIDEKSLINNNSVSNFITNDITKLNDKMNLDRWFEIFTKFYIPLVRSICSMRDDETMSYNIDRFCSIVDFLSRAGPNFDKRPLNERAISYYGNILVSLASTINDELTAEMRTIYDNISPNSKHAAASLCGLRQLAEFIETEIFGWSNGGKLSKVFDTASWPKDDTKVIQEFVGIAMNKDLGI